ncbi:MAG: hemerythrin domain-containing protein [Rhodospirillales bacterium]|nr:hemerythrin domain-containing protein [Rhodospirillales bacterium]HJO71246.1 hemerythrin domain-containing protein [Rhodospirillales bacterium]
MSEVKDGSGFRGYTLATNDAGATTNDEEIDDMKLTDALLGEHGVLYALFEHVSYVVATSNEIGEVRSAVSVLKKLLLSHAKLEEDLLFPNLEPRLGPMGPLAVMRAEHREIDQFFETAKQAEDVDSLKKVVGDLLDVAHAHFQKEEMALFAMARQVLDEATLSRLGDEWAASRKVQVDSQGCMGAA